MFHLPRIGKKI